MFCTWHNARSRTYSKLPHWFARPVGRVFSNPLFTDFSLLLFRGSGPCGGVSFQYLNHMPLRHQLLFLSGNLEPQLLGPVSRSYIPIGFTHQLILLALIRFLLCSWHLGIFLFVFSDSSFKMCLMGRNKIKESLKIRVIF